MKNDVSLQHTDFRREENGRFTNYFMVDELTMEQQEMLYDSIWNAVLKADAHNDKIVVFPEMLGTDSMKERLKQDLSLQPLNNTFFLVFPSVWKKNGPGLNNNTAYIIDGYGIEWFGQGKLRQFPWKRKDALKDEYFIEDIIEADSIHIIHCDGIGSAAVAICRSELDTDIKNILINELNISLILCPSWATGHYEFENSILCGAEAQCNTVWCNCCSALPEKKGYIGIVTAFGKNRNYSSSTFEGRWFSNLACKGKCSKDCLFDAKIYGTDYRESEEDDHEYEER